MSTINAHIRFLSCLTVLATLVLCAPASHAQRASSYVAAIEAIVDQFEQIQASLEVAFRGEDYIRSLQALRYHLRRLDEEFGGRAEGHRASYMLAHRIEDTYLSLVKKMPQGNGRPASTAIEQVSQLNQVQLRLVKAAVSAEVSGGGEAGWVAVIEDYYSHQDYNRAVAMAELASKSYPDSADLLAKLEEVRTRITTLRTNLTEANRLIENRDYRAALTLLNEIQEVAANDATVQELRRVVEEALAKINDLRAEALAYEKDNDLKQAFRSWSKLLDIEPTNEEALEKIKAYKDTFKIVTRRLYRSCPSCRGTGDCEVCKGSKVCYVCNASGRCLRCAGRGYYAATCPQCLCRECKGSGRCATCGGDGLAYCAQCGGRGYETTKVSRPCSNCNGRGVTVFGQRCTVCGGSGKITVNVDKPCSRCRGRKVERCAHCNGTGVCPACGGRGRAETCTYCKGLGRIITECRYCKGTGICLTCDGKGTCRYCKGTGRCSVCAGQKVTVQELEEELLKSEEAGTLAVTSEPSGASLFVDGNKLGASPLDPRKIKPGEHTVRIVKDGFVPLEFAIVSDKDALVEVDVTLISTETYNLRVLAVARKRHHVLFKHYTMRDEGSFMASLTVDGRNRWLRDGEYILGYRVAEIEQITKEQYSSTIGATKLVDYSKLILVNRSGQKLSLPLNSAALLTTYSAKIFDKEYNGSFVVREGSRLGSRLVKSINRERVILVGEDDVELVLPAGQ